METTPPPATSSSSADIRTWNVLCHASALLGFFFPWAGHILAPLIVWLGERRKVLSVSSNDPFSELEIAVSQTTRVNERSAHRRRLPRHELSIVQCAATLDRSSQLAAERRSRFRKSQVREVNNVGLA